MLARFARLALACTLAVGALTPGCGRRASMLDQPPPPATPAPTDADAPIVRAPASVGGASGASCEGRQDCPSDQICVEARCRFRETSVAGEVLATAARTQVDAGDWDAALRTYDQAIERYDLDRAPVPSTIRCAAAALALDTAREREARERGARRADACFRASLPGSAERVPVLEALARVRFEGLDVALFDRDEPVEQYFTQESSRPTVDAVLVEVAMPSSDEPGAAALRAALEAEPARRAIVDCFLGDWDARHERAASASVVVRYATRLRDMGTYDAYDAELAIEPTTVAEDGFEPCVARGLGAAVSAPRNTRIVAWQSTAQISARIR